MTSLSSWRCCCATNLAIRHRPRRSISVLYVKRWYVGRLAIPCPVLTVSPVSGCLCSLVVSIFVFFLSVALCAWFFFSLCCAVYTCLLCSRVYCALALHSTDLLIWLSVCVFFCCSDSLCVSCCLGHDAQIHTDTDTYVRIRAHTIASLHVSPTPTQHHPHPYPPTAPACYWPVRWPTRAAIPCLRSLRPNVVFPPSS